MINFVFVISIALLLLLAFSFIIKNYALSMISAMGIMAIGVHVLSSGFRDIQNILTVAVGLVFVCLGSYIFIRGSLEKIEEFDQEVIKW